MKKLIILVTLIVGFQVYAAKSPAIINIRCTAKTVVKDGDFEPVFDKIVPLQKSIHQTITQNIYGMFFQISLMRVGAHEESVAVSVCANTRDSNRFCTIGPDKEVNFTVGVAQEKEVIINCWEDIPKK